MGFLLSKVLTLLATPIGVTLFLCVVALIFSYLQRHSLSRVSIMLAIACLWFGSTSLFSDSLYRNLEQTYPNVAVAQLPKAEAIVVLGGGVRAAAPPNEFPDLNQAGDRLLHGARLYKAGKADKIILSGGQVFPNEIVASGAFAMKRLLIEWGVDEEDILLEEKSRTTYENAVETKKLLQEKNWQRVLLVTSAGHMPRSMCSFQKAGIDAIPASTDYEITDSPGPWVFNVMPSSGAHDLAARGIKEYLGRWVYQLRGWC